MNFQQALDIGQVNGEQVIPTVCGMCGPGGPGGGCGIYAFVRDGRFIKAAGMDESPVNKGKIGRFRYNRRELWSFLPIS